MKRTKAHVLRQQQWDALGKERDDAERKAVIIVRLSFAAAVVIMGILCVLP